ncbi:T9SS type B sorting domain-containing protein [Flavobacterium panacagri]|uniref:T9SS type B sorting domain-containing protein n=1 Tax=Flavobacterium panacagri TaxID=3034146 RepID=UPI0025A54E61|nr:T9SS type B sorting domain-containing protein [Flavobacterium panacagri]
MNAKITLTNTFGAYFVKTDRLPCGKNESRPFVFNLNLCDLHVCDNDTDGFAEFNLKAVENLIVGNTTNLKVQFYHQNGEEILGVLTSVTNLVVKEEIIKVRVTNLNTGHCEESTFKLIVNPLPIANSLQELMGFDPNNDGISEYFDTSNIESAVLGNQKNMTVSFFDSGGSQLPCPLPNPFTNTIKNQETLTVRVTNNLTSCYAETTLVLKTTSQPIIKNPCTKYTCDEGGGFGIFDLSDLTSEIIGNQSGLKIMYFDDKGNSLPSPLPNLFENTQSRSQTIKVRVENELNSLCSSETSFDLVVNDLPVVNINKVYSLCELEASVFISVDESLDSYTWQFQNTYIVSNSSKANLTSTGKYTLIVGKIQNDIYCENRFEFEVVRSVRPTIKEIKYQELSDNNFIEIIPSAEGNLEYSIDGINYQQSNYFSSVQEGIYIAYMRDKKGCGQDWKEVTIIDYPKFFTPNNDGFNDLWQIKSSAKYPNSKIAIFDRYGKLIAELSANNSGWDGSFNGSALPADDYWFKAKFNDKINFSGHFSLKR